MEPIDGLELMELKDLIDCKDFTSLKLPNFYPSLFELEIVFIGLSL
jgi:hypothetical protein